MTKICNTIPERFSKLIFIRLDILFIYLFDENSSFSWKKVIWIINTEYIYLTRNPTSFATRSCIMPFVSEVIKKHHHVFAFNIGGLCLPTSFFFLRQVLETVPRFLTTNTFCLVTDGYWSIHFNEGFDWNDHCAVLPYFCHQK